MTNFPNKIKNLIKCKKKFNVPKFLIFSVSEFNVDFERVYLKSKKKFQSKVIVRSAFSQEDTKKSLAGHFLSIGNINIKNKVEFFSSIKKVIGSYGDKIKNQRFFIQEMIDDSIISGVIFTTDAESGFPFTTINFSLGDDTSQITSGSQSGFSYRFLNSRQQNEKKYFIDKIQNLSKKMVKLFKKKNLDIEFSINKTGFINIFQVRKINNYKNVNEEKINFAYEALEKKLYKIINDESFLFGKTTFFSNMTDWNPAEILGIKPNPLSLSIYQELITDSIWSRSRSEFGYTDLGEIPLMYSFLGTPFIDIRADFNSFIPENLPKELKQKLVDFYLLEFKKNHNFLHDKVESHLIISHTDFNTKKKINSLKNFSQKEKKVLEIELQHITNRSFKVLNESINKYKQLDHYSEKIKKNKKHQINNIFNLINICKNLGTLPFANIARCAFISMNFLKSMVDLKILNESELREFLNSLRTITGEMLDSSLEDNKKVFTKKFGHLRPNTYDFNSKNYKDNYDLYFSDKHKRTKKGNFNFSQKQKILISQKLIQNNISLSFEKFEHFLRKSIIEREKSKFYFSKVINQIFEELESISKRFNLNHEDIQFLNIKSVKALYNNFSMSFTENQLKKEIKKNKKDFCYNRNFLLPNVIIKKDDIYSYFDKNKSATFVTNKKITSKVYEIKNYKDDTDIRNKIVCISNADPGFDFLFTKKISGLITEFGGPNSHMFIRCNELKIPAAIGVGRYNYKKVCDSGIIDLDCNNKKITFDKL